MKYYKSLDFFYAVDDNGHLHWCAENGTAWEEIPESSPLEAVVLLGSNAFPKEAKKRNILRLLCWPLRAFALLFARLEEKGQFIGISVVLIVAMALVGICVRCMIMESGRKNFDSGAPSHIVVEYDNGTAISYPIKNEKAIVVSVKEKR
jgi:hypothetical protein